MAFRFTGSGSTSVGLGLLVIRVGIGLNMLVFHGYGKITAGPDSWTKLGGNMEHVGIGMFPLFWGFMAALSEGVCSALIIIGFPFRPAAFLLCCTMAVAASHHLSIPADQPGGGIDSAAHALEFLAVFLGLLITGPGKYGLRWVRTRSAEG